jgi:hypothetical protein
MLRCTRLANLVNTTDPKLVAAALGMNPGSIVLYLADHVGAARLPERRATDGRVPPPPI